MNDIEWWPRDVSPMDAAEDPDPPEYPDNDDSCEEPDEEEA